MNEEAKKLLKERIDAMTAIAPSLIGNAKMDYQLSRLLDEEIYFNIQNSINLLNVIIKSLNVFPSIFIFLIVIGLIIVSIFLI